MNPGDRVIYTPDRTVGAGTIQEPTINRAIQRGDWVIRWDRGFIAAAYEHDLETLR
jgi:hypothetical protein